MKKTVKQIFNDKQILWCMIIFVSSISIFCLCQGLNYLLLSLSDRKETLFFGELFFLNYFFSFIKWSSLLLAITAFLTGFLHLPKKDLHIKTLCYNKKERSELKKIKLNSYLLSFLYSILALIALFLHNYWLALFFLILIVVSIFYSIWFLGVMKS